MGELTKGMDNVNLLADIQGLKNIPTKARGLIARDIPTPTLAVFDASTRLCVLGILVLKMLPRVKEIRLFATEEETRARPKGKKE